MSMIITSFIMIIGITGLAGAGKDTFAAILKNYFDNLKIPKETKIYHYADILKKICIDLYNMNPKMVYDNNLKEVPSKLLDGKSPRQILQDIGTKLREYDKDIFVKHMNNVLTTKDTDTSFIIADVRFDNEALLIKEHNGIIIHIERPGTPQMDHVTEKGISKDLIDFHILNNSDIEGLRMMCNTLFP
jgi:hypothetical protein